MATRRPPGTELGPPEITPAVARKNLLFGLALAGVFVALFFGTILVAFIYLAVAD